MPKFIADIINQINYNANFEFDKNTLPNVCPTNNVAQCKVYIPELQDHIQRVANCWFKDTGIETAFVYAGGYHPTTPLPLRWIAENEQNVNQRVLADIDDIIRLHDRSRYSEDEFFAGAAASGTPYQISKLKHYQRNAHEFSHYIYHTEAGQDIVLEMPEVFIWIKIAVWLANFSDSDYRYNTNLHKNPFQHYWGRNFKVTRGGHIPPPELPQLIAIGDATQNRIEEIVDRWELPDESEDG